MGRGCTMDEWNHFEKRPQEGRVPNSSYWYVVCTHCVRGYEQKQLPSYPSSLTGRRSAMRAHLKVCPIYGAQYRMEQQQQSDASYDDITANSGMENSSPTQDSRAGQPTKSLSENASETFLRSSSNSVTSDIKEEDDHPEAQDGSKIFNRSRQRFSGSNSRGRSKHCMMEEWNHFIRLQEEGYIGKSNFFYAICKHCNEAYMEAPEEKKPQLIPEKMVGRREKMRKHLSMCPHFKGDLPPMERRVHLRHGLIPNIFAARTFATSNAVNQGNNAYGGLTSPLSSATGTLMTTGNGGSQSNSIVNQFGISVNGGNSRLALDEWNYFTRLERRKDSAYYFARCNFCQVAYENASENIKASMEPTIVMGRKSNMQTHLSKCPHVPKDPSLLANMHANSHVPLGSSGITSASSIGDATASDVTSFLGGTPFKRQKLAGDPSLVGNGESMYTQLYQCTLRFMFHHGFPFEWIEHSSTVDLFSCMYPRDPSIPYGITLPQSALELRTNILDAVVRDQELSESVKFHSDLESHMNSLTVTSHNLPRVVLMEVNCIFSQDTAIPQLDFVVRCGNTHLTLAAFKKNVQQKIAKESTKEQKSMKAFHGLEVARMVESAIEDVETGDGNYRMGIVLFPCGREFVRAASILRNRWPRIVFTYDIHDLLHFPFLKFLEQLEVKSFLNQLIANEEESRPNSGAELNWRYLNTLAQSALKDSPSLLSVEQAKESEEPVNSDIWISVASFLDSFVHVMDGVSGARGKLGDVIMHFGTLYQSAEAFPAVQEALEAVWSALPHPFYILGNALHPHLRLQGISASNLTKSSMLSDSSVAYYQRFFGQKSNALRGDVTAYMHSSREVFLSNFIAEFPMIEDFFRYLSDNFSDLASLMELLCSNGPLMVQKRGQSFQLLQNAIKTGLYSDEEVHKLRILASYWQLEDTQDTHWNHLQAQKKVDAPSCTRDMVATYRDQLIERLKFGGIDMDFLSAISNSADEASMTEAASMTIPANINEDETITLHESHLLPLVEQEEDDLSLPANVPPTEIWQERKIALRDLFHAREATI
uniref:Uncharacterized protein AlNc14C210G8899 n=1 Tax=Albugo laibachii Nc14 TaxID=890382 RepID=F0WR92_9STRA|nr:conserved hypothetical protein [Albugo laibachii Nc14]CCA24038.1 conserved hypothetical protein [Albugo laibachii Nc14]|eukprot:CCA24038.1 conserved hypothetical protein [Albugo laibachii Nc14]